MLNFAERVEVNKGANQPIDRLQSVCLAIKHQQHLTCASSYDYLHKRRGVSLIAAYSYPSRIVYSNNRDASNRSTFPNTNFLRAAGSRNE